MSDKWPYTPELKKVWETVRVNECPHCHADPYRRCVGLDDKPLTVVVCHPSRAKVARVEPMNTMTSAWKPLFTPIPDYFHPGEKNE